MQMHLASRLWRGSSGASSACLRFVRCDVSQGVPSSLSGLPSPHVSGGSCVSVFACAHAQVNELGQGFTVENEMLTPSMKLKRPQITKKYQKVT